MDEGNKQSKQGMPQGFCPLVCPECGSACRVISLTLSSFKGQTICISCRRKELKFKRTAPQVWIDRLNEVEEFESHVSIIFGYFIPKKKELLQKQFDAEERED